MAKPLAKVKVGDLLKAEKMNQIIERINNLEKRLDQLEGKTHKKKIPEKKTLKMKTPEKEDSQGKESQKEDSEKEIAKDCALIPY